MSVARLAVAGCAALFLAACGIGKPLPHTTTYVVEPILPAPAPERRGPSTASARRGLAAGPGA